MKQIKCIGILTSGGDASGMNAAIRAVTRSAICNGYTVKGIYRGYEGLIRNEIKELTTQDVSSIIQRGGTILKTARSKDFMTPEGRKVAYNNMVAAGIDALVVIGGNGSLSGAQIFANEFDVPCIGLPEIPSHANNCHRQTSMFYLLLFRGNSTPCGLYPILRLPSVSCECDW